MVFRNAVAFAAFLIAGEATVRAVAYSRCMSYLDSLLSSLDGRLDELAAEIDRLEAARTALDSPELGAVSRRNGKTHSRALAPGGPAEAGRAVRERTPRRSCCGPRTHAAGQRRPPVPASGGAGPSSVGRCDVRILSRSCLRTRRA